VFGAVADTVVVAVLYGVANVVDEGYIDDVDVVATAPVGLVGDALCSDS